VCGGARTIARLLMTGLLSVSFWRVFTADVFEIG